MGYRARQVSGDDSKISMNIRKTVFLWLWVVFVVPAWGRVFVHWTQSAIPSPKALGVNDLVLSWDAGTLSLLNVARRQDYRIYLEATLPEAAAAAEASAKNGVAGLILDVRQPEQGQVDGVVGKLQSAYPKLTLLVLNPDGKQPQMKGGLVIKRGEILEVSSPTAQPWLDTNLALVRFQQSSRPGQVPLYSFHWDLSDPLKQQNGPTAEDYSLAVAESDAFQADLVLPLHENLQIGLAKNDAGAWTLWNEVKRYLEFASHTPVRLDPAANMGIVTDDYETSYEPINLLARHNIPFRIFRPTDLQSHSLKDIDVLVVFDMPDRQTIKLIGDFADQGGIAILVDLPGSYPWQSVQRVETAKHWAAYAMGQGRIIELSEPLTDPETFAQDIRRLMDKQKLISFWNALTTVAVPYRDSGAVATILELVNYAQDPLRVQVQVRGSYTSIQYETPEHRCCESLTPVHHDGFTEFVVPWLRIGGRVHLRAGGSAAHEGPSRPK